MKIYLDTCSLQRPLDSRNQIRIILEAEAVLGLLSLVDSGQADLVSSEALLFETERNPNMVRRQYALEVLSKADTFIVLNEQIERFAEALVSEGLKPLDALHWASAEEPKQTTCVRAMITFSEEPRRLQVQGCKSYLRWS